MLITQSEGFSANFRTIKHNHLFLVDDTQGRVPYGNTAGLGFYYLDTRFLSAYDIRLNHTSPVMLLSSTEVGHLSTLVYTNGQIESCTEDGGCVRVPEETIQIKRESVLNGALYERICVTNYNLMPLCLKLSFRFDADFQDIFEVRHLAPDIYGEKGIPRHDHKENRLVFPYRDGVGRELETIVRFMNFSPEIDNLLERPVECTIEMMLPSLEPREFFLEIRPVFPNNPYDSEKLPGDFHGAVRENAEWARQWDAKVTRFESDNEDFNEMLSRSHKDIRMLMTTNVGTNGTDETYVAAGIPWYVTLFGRDSLITARYCLMLCPEIACCTLKTLAKYQGKSDDPWRDEEPGKILHEMRVGELARLGKIPHTPYYGTVDATPLWLVLLYDYYLWTRDKETLEDLWPNAMAALGWIDANLESHRLNYAAYECRSLNGLYHQNWKDSHNSAMYASGKQARPPLAHAEVQGYVYLAKKRLARLSDVMGDKTLSRRLRKEAREFRNRFNRDFWVDGMNYCAMSLDSKGKPLEVIASNPGHCLETGIFTAPHARHVASRLMAPDMFNGWGIRTLSSETLSYNPMSYHNGSIWPHDNAFIARGISRLKRPDDVVKLFTSFFEAGRLMYYKRMPELYCGFPRDPAKCDPPVKYPVACSPQAWAAASVYSFLQSLLNMAPRWESQALTIRRPALPSWLGFLRIENLQMAGSTVSLEFRRTEKSVLVDVVDRQGRLDVILEK